MIRLISRRFYSSHPQSKLRNIGVIAHVDAGKTTVTERFLYLAGAIQNPGHVDKGTTVTDFLDIERERGSWKGGGASNQRSFSGITVQSAAVNLDWNGHRINLIDTPGHVDFRVEVERCVRVLDGIVVVIDGSAGVQPQTLTVWDQSSKFKLPAHFFINKLDKKEANFERSVDSIEQKLGVKAVKTVVPLDDGVLDVLKGRHLKMDGEWSHVATGTREYDALLEAKSDLCYSISDHSQNFMTMFLDENEGDPEKMSVEKIKEVLRELTISSKIATVSCGSAIRNLHCVQPILNSVVDFFPSPDLRNHEFQQVFHDDLSGLVFKITHDKRRGQLSYIRIYTGRLQNNSNVFNTSQMTSEGPLKVFTPYADELKSVDHVDQGNIAVVSGLENTVTGDTVMGSAASADRAFETLKSLDHSVDLLQTKTSHEGRSVVFSGIESPDAVFFCCIEPPSNRQQQQFNRALEELTQEDPSMKIRFDRDTGQTIVETQGELHLEAIKDRLKRNYKLDVFIGKLQVAYREMLTEELTHEARVEDGLSEKKRPEFVQLTLRLEPTKTHVPFKKIELDLPQTAKPTRLDWQKAINEGCSNALQNGPLASYPVHAVRVVITECIVSGGKINPALLSACAQKCVTEALAKGEMVLTEPVMSIQIDVRSDEPTQPILNELTRRRAQFEHSDAHSSTEYRRISATLPLSETENLSKTVRTLTSGFGDISVQFSGYQHVPDHEKNSILQRRMGGF
uniref:Tr-type G domain-containing protein n=1 Tax=Caenorhabditis tropicalis TaxID=1561998 RepID=A0A1I7UK57_9PELO